MNDYRIVAPHFVVRITTGGHVSSTGDEWIMATAPILKWVKGWPMDRFRAYAARKGWTIEPLDFPAHSPTLPMTAASRL